MGSTSLKQYMCPNWPEEGMAAAASVAPCWRHEAERPGGNKGFGLPFRWAHVPHSAIIQAAPKFTIF